MRNKFEYLDLNRCKQLVFGDTSLTADLDKRVLYASSPPPALNQFEFEKWGVYLDSCWATYYVGRCRFLYVVLEKNIMGHPQSLLLKNGKIDVTNIIGVEGNRAIDVVKKRLQIDDALLLDWLWIDSSGRECLNGYVASRSSIESGGTPLRVELGIDDDLSSIALSHLGLPQLGLNADDFSSFNEESSSDISEESSYYTREEGSDISQTDNIMDTQDDTPTPVEQPSSDFSEYDSIGMENTIETETNIPDLPPQPASDNNLIGPIPEINNAVERINRAKEIAKRARKVGKFS